MGKIKIDDEDYNLVIIRKNNKNTYIRVNDNLEITVTTGYFSTKSSIKRLVFENEETVKKMLNRKKKEAIKEESFHYLGEKYDIITVPTIKSVEFENNRIFTPNKEVLEKWLKKNTLEIFKERLDIIFNQFEENIPYPKLKIRSMKTRWGVCNKRDNSVTLNSKLIKEALICLDYVIIHELSHFIHFNHSKDFWLLVEKYLKDYKKIRKKLRE
jgi:Predicted metal-dependent hydrolase